MKYMKAFLLHVLGLSLALSSQLVQIAAEHYQLEGALLSVCDFK